MANQNVPSRLKIVEYKTLSADSTMELDTLVMQAIEQRYQPWGNPYYHGNLGSIHQVVVLYRVGALIKR